MPALIRTSILAGLLIYLVGCSEHVDPVLGTEMPFSMFGILTPERDTQAVRVYPIEDRLRPLPDERLAARFTSEDLPLGEHRVWQDSVTTEAYAGRGHVYWQIFRAEFDRVYRITLERDDGAVTYADARVPPRVDVNPGDVRTVPEVTLPVHIMGDRIVLSKLRVMYRVLRLGTGLGDRTRRLIFHYQGRQEKSADGWSVLINLTRDAEQIKKLMGFPPFPTEIVLLELKVLFSVLDEAATAPDGVYDPEVLVQPGTMSNVVNGFGIVTGGYRDSTRIPLPDDQALVAAGFVMQ